MRIRWFAAALAAVMLCGVGSAQAGRRIMTWVPSYGIATSYTAINKRYGQNFGPVNSLTHVALQFWVPKADGTGIQYSTDGNPDDAAVIQFVKWGRLHGVKILLCIYNDVPHTANPPGNYSWDWDYAKNAFSTHRAQFVNSVIAEMKRLKLDGVDIDFEAPDQFSTGEHDGDKGVFVNFLKVLKARVEILGKELSTVSFPYIFNGPNSTWWSSILPHVDALTSMGYQDTGRSAPSWQNYSWQRKHAGQFAARLQVGMPSNLASWPASWPNTALQQVNWAHVANDVGIGIWDAQLAAAAWQDPTLWRTLYLMRHEQSAD